MLYHTMTLGQLRDAVVSFIEKYGEDVLCGPSSEYDLGEFVDDACLSPVIVDNIGKVVCSGEDRDPQSFERIAIVIT